MYFQFKFVRVFITIQNYGSLHPSREFETYITLSFYKYNFFTQIILYFHYIFVHITFLYTLHFCTHYISSTVVLSPAGGVATLCKSCLQTEQTALTLKGEEIVFSIDICSYFFGPHLVSNSLDRNRCVNMWTRIIISVFKAIPIDLPSL